MKKTDGTKKQPHAPVVVHSIAQHEGPLPHSKELREYDALITDGANRIMQMAEKAQAHHAEMQKEILQVRERQSRREHGEVLTGQIFAFFLCAGALVGGIILVMEGFHIIGALLSGASLASVLKTLITRK